MIKIVYTHGHFEVYMNGRFLFSADTMSEAIREMNNHEEVA